MDIAGLEQVAGVFELTEAVGQLRGAAPAAKEAVTGLVTSLGAGGLGLAGAAVVAVGAISLVAEELNKAFTAGNREIKAGITAEQAVADDLASGAGTDEMFRTYAEFTRQSQTEVDKLDKINERLKTIDNSDPFSKIVSKFSGVTDSVKEEYDKQAEVVAEAVNKATLYKDAIDSGAVAENDRAKAIFDSTEAMARQYQVEQRVNQFAQSATAETLDARLGAIQTEHGALKAQQSELTPLLADNTEAGAKARAQFDLLESQIQDLNTESGLLNGIIGEQIRVRDQETEAIKVQTDAQKEADIVNRERANSLAKLTELEKQQTKRIVTGKQ